MILALDTSTHHCDVAIVEGDYVRAHRGGEGAMAHGELLGVLVRDAFIEAGIGAEQISSVAVGTGPGPFTGLRVGLAFARTFALARGVAARGICSLDVIAADSGRVDEYLVATDARRKEIYWARYQGTQRVDGPHVNKPEHVSDMNLPIIGEGARTYADQFGTRFEVGPLVPSAVVLARLVEAGIREGRDMPIDALYLRQPDVTV